MNIKKFLTKVFLNPWVPATVISAFAAFILFIHAGSYAAETHNTAGLWKAIAWVMVVSTVTCGIKLINTSRG